MSNQPQRTRPGLAFQGRRLNLIIRILLSAFLVAVLAYNIGSGRILEHLASASWRDLALATAILAVSVFLVTPRWGIILSVLGCRTSWRDLFGSVFLGFLFNQLLPTAVGGDVLRAWRAKQLGADWEIAIHSVFLDRATGVAISLLGAFVLLPFASIDDKRLLAIVLVFSALMIAGLLVLWAARRWSQQSSLLGPVRERLANLYESIVAIARQPRAGTKILVLATLNQLLPVAAFLIIARDLHVELPVLDIALITFIGALVGTLPISVAGWGIREGAIVYLFGMYGVPADVAFAVSVLYGACLTFMSLPGLFMLVGRNNVLTRLAK